METTSNSKTYLVKSSDLPLHCPTPAMSLWNTHPRVFLDLDIENKSQAICPYCGTQFILEKNVTAQ